MVKHVPARQETQDMRVQDLGREVPLEEEMATHSSILGRRMLWTTWWATVHGVAKSQTWLSDWATLMHISSVQSLSRLRLCDPMNRSTPGLPVHCSYGEFPNPGQACCRAAAQTWGLPVGSGLSPSRTLPGSLFSFGILSVVPLLGAGEWDGWIKLGRRHHVRSEKIKFSECWLAFSALL